MKNVKSLYIDNEGKGIITCPNHGYHYPVRFEIMGADQEIINGEWEAESTPDSNTIIFYAGQDLSNTVITGNIKIRVPPLGWDKVFSDVNKAVYRARKGNRHFLYIDDSVTDGAVYGASKVRVFEHMDSINEPVNNSWMWYGDILKSTNV